MPGIWRPAGGWGVRVQEEESERESTEGGE